MTSEKKSGESGNINIFSLLYNMKPKRQKASEASLELQASHQPPKSASVWVNSKQHLTFFNTFSDKKICNFFSLVFFQAFLTKMGLYECIFIENIKKITGTFRFILQRSLESCALKATSKQIIIISLIRVSKNLLTNVQLSKIMSDSRRSSYQNPLKLHMQSQPKY